MNGIEWPGESVDTWPEAFGFGDFAKGALMPHTIPGMLGKRIFDGGRGKVVQHTQPPPVAQNAREIQGQFTGLLKTVKGVEEKVDDATRQLALLQRASAGNVEAALFRQSLANALLAVKVPGQKLDLLRIIGHLIPLFQNGSGAVASVSAHPIATFAVPLLAALVANAREIRELVDKDERDRKEKEFYDKIIARMGKKVHVG